jgi:ribosome maturation factor RimP
MIELQIEQYTLEKLEDPGFEDFYLVEVRFNPANKKAEVYIDSDSGLSLGDTSRINRYLQERIDESGILGEKYILDVSSPGVGRPLKLVRQYTKNIGRTLEVTFKEEGEERPLKRKGILTQVNGETSITIQYDIKEKQGKKKITKTVDKEIAFDKISKAVVKPTF